MMRWTKEEPKEDGYYWLRKDIRLAPQIVKVEDYEVWEVGWDVPFGLFSGWEWSGPLSCPDEEV
jgi:hypothetical protein